MTMPYESVEEPDTTYVQEQSIPVRVVSSGRGSSAAEFGQWRTFTITPTTGPQRLVPRSLRRKRLLIKVNPSLPIGLNPVPGQPAVPTSTTAVQNPNPYPVSVALTGGTTTVISVNGQQVGTTTPATVLVPSGGTIAVTYTVAPTWVWSNANLANQLPTDGVFLTTRDTANNVAGPASIPFTLGTFANGGYLQVNDNIRWEVQAELWVLPNSANSATVYVTIADEMYASDPMANNGRYRNGDDDG